MNLYLTGYRCTGKTTVGRIVAEMLGREFIDADEYLVAKAGRTIKEIFETDGEPLFRYLESECLRELASKDGLVVATGGGVILREANVQQLASSGRVVLLEADAKTVHERMQADQLTRAQRPSLTARDPLEEIEELLGARRPRYEGTADHRVDTTKSMPEELARQIVEFLAKEATA